MAEIYLCALKNDLGPDVPSDLGAWLRDKKWLGGGTVKELVLSIEDSTIIIWPADPDAINSLADRLKEIVSELRLPLDK